MAGEPVSRDARWAAETRRIAAFVFGFLVIYFAIAFTIRHFFPQVYAEVQESHQHSIENRGGQ